MNEEEREFLQSEQEYETDKAEAIEAIKKFAEEEETEDENDMGDISWKTILGGDILQSKFVLHQVVFCMFVVLLMLIYTANRYSSQQDALLIDSLKIQLQEQQYKVLTIEGDLLNISRQSKIETLLKNNGDSLLTNPAAPPFAIRNEEKNEE